MHNRFLPASTDPLTLSSTTAPPHEPEMETLVDSVLHNTSIRSTVLRTGSNLSAGGSTAAGEGGVRARSYGQAQAADKISHMA